MDDVNVSVEQQRSAYTNMERKQKKFDAMLSEEKNNSSKLLAEREQIEKEAREKETKILNLQKELDELKEKHGETERVRGVQQKELEELVSSKDDVGKNVSYFWSFSAEFLDASKLWTFI